KSPPEAETVGQYELRLLRRDGRALGILDHRRRGEGGVLAALGERDRLLRAERPRMEEIQVFRMLGEALGLRQPGAVVLRRVPRDGERGVHRLLERRARDIRRAGVAAAHLGAFAEIDRNADRAVAVVLDGIGL